MLVVYRCMSCDDVTNYICMSLTSPIWFTFNNKIWVKYLSLHGRYTLPCYHYFHKIICIYKPLLKVFHHFLSNKLTFFLTMLHIPNISIKNNNSTMWNQFFLYTCVHQMMRHIQTNNHRNYTEDGFLYPFTSFNRVVKQILSFT